MSPAHSPWFFSESLRSRFAQDIKDALEAERITEQQALWLESLLEPEDHETALPRVDRLLHSDDGLTNSGLAGALLISDPRNHSPEFYLHTPLDGVERFDSHQQLMTGLTDRFALSSDDLKRVESEQVEGELFEPLMLAIVDQQAQQLHRLDERLHLLSSLHMALGQALQQQVDVRFPDSAIDVFTHVAQIKQVDTETPAGITVGTETLVNVAVDAWCGKPLASGVRHQWLDNQGHELTGVQANAMQQAVASVGIGLSGVYEGLLDGFWRASTGEGLTLHDLAGHAFVECFRQHLLNCRQEGTVTASEYTVLKSLCQAGVSALHEVEMSRVSIAISNQDPLKLAGVVLIGFDAEQLSDLFLYSAKQGLRRFNSVGAVAAHFAGIAGRSEIFDYASLNDDVLLRTQGSLQLRLDPVSTTPLIKLADSVIALQKRNLVSVLKLSFKSPAQAAVNVERALDIRHLIDPRLCAVEGRRSWSDNMADSEQRWSSFAAPSRVSALGMHLKDGDSLTPLIWATYLRDARVRVDSIFEAHPRVGDYAQRLLSRYISAVYGKTVDARRMWFRADDDSVVSLSVLLLDRLTGHSEAMISQDCHVYFDPADSAYSTHLAWLTSDLLNHVMDLAQKAFVKEYPLQLKMFHGSQLRIRGSSVLPANASRLVREGLLRLTLSMHRKASEVRKKGLDMLQQVLDRPVFKLRERLGFEAVEVSIPSLVYDSAHAPIPLTNMFILQQPLAGDGRPVQWSAVLGLREFDSIAALQLDLKARLTFLESRDKWLNLIAEPERQKIQAFFKQNAHPRITVSMARVEGDFLQRLVDDELSRQCLGIEAAYQTALDWQADAGLLQKMQLPMASDDKTRTAIDTLSGQLEYTLLAGFLPDWLSKASEGDLLAFRELMVRFWQLYTAQQKAVLLSTLEQYTVAQVRERLKKDFPSLQLDPDRISITLTHYTVAPVGAGDVPSSIPAATSVVSESLSAFAINRFSRFQNATLSVSSMDVAPLPATFNALYVLDLARTLDVAAGYQQYLKEAFSETSSDYLDRLDQFTEQAPCALLLTAFQLRLKGTLTRTAYDFIETVVSMPDGIARLPVDGKTIVFSPLQLVAAEGYAADTAAGIYLIGPQNQSDGPWVLHVIASADYIFKEYASQSDFMTDLQTSTELQALVLERMDPTVRFVYERGGFLQPRLSWATGGFTDLGDAHPGPVQLRVEPVQENFLLSVFRAAQEVMMLMAKRDSVTNSQADRAESGYLFLLGIEQSLTFLPGRIGGLVGLWQAKDLLHSSLNSVKDDQWGEAVAEFAAALLVLITTSQQLGEGEARLSGNDADADDLAEPNWHDRHIQKDLDTRLRQFEAKDISLSHLQKDAAHNVFKDPVTLKQYAAVSGKVYQVKNGPNGWCVIEGDKNGPLIRLGNKHHWVFDTEVGARRNGGALTRFQASVTDYNVDDVFVIDARGMAEVQRLYPQKAKQIVEAHGQARTYLRNALDNLTVRATRRVLDSRTERILKDFFGVKALTNKLVIPVKKTASDIYRLLLDPTLSPHSSQRYVVGTNKLNSRDTTAFTYTNDPLQRVFLSERFFCSPYIRLQPMQSRRGGFNIGAHYRATALIHELSHIAGKTDDIVYVDSEMPFLDLLEDTGEYRARLKRAQAKNQSNLSHQTPRDELFKVEDGGVWRDLKTSDGPAKKNVLKLTGASTIDAARDVFLSDADIRAKVILSNADSVALLISLLGRERFE